MIMKNQAGEGRSDFDAMRSASSSGQAAASRINTTAIHDFLQTAPLLLDPTPESPQWRLVDDGRGDNTSRRVLAASSTR